MDPDAEAWKAAEALNTASAYRAYLEAYPSGRFTAGAKIKLSAPNRLAVEKPAAKPPAEPLIQNTRPSGEDPESQFWNEVKSSGSREYYDAYLKQYPKGKYVALARLEIKKQDDKDKADKAREDAERKADQARQEAAETTAEGARQRVLVDARGGGRFVHVFVDVGDFHLHYIALLQFGLVDRLAFRAVLLLSALGVAHIAG